MISLAVLLVLSYLLGAFPSSVVYGKLFRKVDVRKHGSGNAGGTNAWRVLGWKIGLPVMLTDVAKGALASLVIARIPLGTLPLEFSTVASPLSWDMCFLSILDFAVAKAWPLLRECCWSMPPFPLPARWLCLHSRYSCPGRSHWGRYWQRSVCRFPSA